MKSLTVANVGKCSQGWISLRFIKLPFEIAVSFIGLKNNNSFLSFLELSFGNRVQNAAVDMEKAVSELEEAGVDSYILDLRNNPVCVRLF